MSSPMSSHSMTRAIGRVAAREFGVRVASTSFVAVTAVLVIASAVAILLVSVFGGDGETEARQIGVAGGPPVLADVLVGTGTDLEQPVEVSRVPDATAARSQVEAGDLDAVVVAEPDGSYTVITESVLAGELREVVTSAVEQATLDQALAAAGADPQTVRVELERATVAVAPLDPPDPDLFQRILVAYITVILLFFSTFFYGLNVAIGVVEEKSSRVVELLLSTIKPVELLTGTVLGIGAVGLVQLTAIGGIALITSVATGVVTLGGTAVALFFAALAWYVLGFTFYALLYAAAGSLVSRQEDVNGITLPLVLVSFVAFMAAQLALTSPGNTVIDVLAWIPPFSATLMPIRIAQGDATALQVVLTFVIMIGASVAAASIASRIYRRSVLNTGSKQSLRTALSRT